MAGNRILVAVALQRYSNITPLAVAIREVAAEHARASGASLTVMTVHFPVAKIPEARQRTEEKLDRFITPIVEEGLEVETRIVEGSPRVMIQGVASEIGARLIVMGTHTKRGLDTAIGGTARAVIKSAPCRVVLVAPTVEESRRTREMIVPDYPVIFPYGWGHAAKH